jgi:hypothetical protein
MFLVSPVALGLAVRHVFGIAEFYAVHAFAGKPRRAREFQRKVWVRVLVSDSRKLVFVHIQKTGGVTVLRLLQKNIPDLRTVVARHAFASQGMEKLDGWDEYFRFAFVRNPWDRLVSWHTMIRTAQEIKARPWNKRMALCAREQFDLRRVHPQLHSRRENEERR